MRVTRESIIAFMGNPGYRPLRIRDLARSLKVGHDAYRGFRRLVDEMTERGELVEVRHGKYALPGAGGFVTGRLHGHQGGFGFVELETDEPDIFIRRDAMGRALHGDTVMVRVFGRRHGLNPEGEVVRVLERGNEPVIGTYTRKGKSGFVTPDDPRINQDIQIEPDEGSSPETGQKVVARITRWPSGERLPSGRVIEILGYPDDPNLDILVLIRSYDLPLDFPTPVEEEAARIPETIPEALLAGRLDLRDRLCFTIDPPDARDFDDAVSIEPLTGGQCRLGVHIADVSAFVPEGGLIDREALYRGNSVYLVDRALPMLPHRLTGHICSLKPGVDRLTMSVFMDINSDGDVQRYTIHDSVIRSARRFTYEEAQNVMENAEAQGPDPDPVRRDLMLLRDLSRRLLQRRLREGSLDFDLPEPLVILDDQKKPVEVRRSERLESHRLIEECMLVANRTVAGHLLRTELPAMYRIHEKPAGEKLTELMTFLAGFGYQLTPADVAHPVRLQQFLSSIQDQPDHGVINDLVIRSMKKARYSVENAGHYGLAFKWYTHFTSPIRRYPDLVVHRLLREYADGPVSAERRDHLERALDKAADIASKREKLADEVERESIKIKQTEYMETRIGESFDGVISGMIPNGFFVELSDTLIEGMVSLASLKDDYYVLDALTRRLIGSRSGRTFHLGMRVHVMVVRADRRLRHIDFELIRAEETTPAKPMKSVRGKKGARPAHPVRAAGKRPPGLIRGSKKSSGRRFSGNPKRRGRR